MRNPAARVSLQVLVSMSLCAGVLGGVGCTKPAAAETPIAGQELFASCVVCHGVNAGGDPKIGAPAIAGLPAWYIEAQLTKFRTGVRGYHPDDLEGLRMRPMSRELLNAGEVKAVAAHVASLAPTRPAPTLEGGDAVAGAAAYAVCVACHGPDGKGLQAVNAPPLVGQSDWYLLTQLKKFKAGIRGANPADTSGGTMAPMSLTLPDEQAMKNVLAHVATLNR